MGLHKISNCVFTGLHISNYEDGEARDAIEYYLELPTHKILIRLPREAINWKDNNEFFKDHLHLFQILLNTNNWFKNERELVTIDKLKEFITKILIPNTPQEKADLLFRKYLAMQTEDGQVVNLTGEFYNLAWKELFFKSHRELTYYTEYLNKKGLIVANFLEYPGGMKLLEDVYVTVEGLNYGILMEAEGEKSNLCFIALAFRPETANIRNAIKEALFETGFQPVIIDEQHINSDKTINDEIIASLKRCKFCIADFSYHSNGVYFESGFALGQNKKVIYTCLESEFNKAHFDIRPLQHIIYKTAEQLKIDLKNKIDAWIK